MSQCTDDIAFCGVRARDGWLRVDPIQVGNRSFLGPGAILRGGTRIADDSLVGVMTLPPLEPAAGTSWLGVPALELPRVPDAVDPARTIAPPRRLVCARGAMDLVRLLVPTAIAIVIEALEVLGIAWLCVHAGIVLAILSAPLVLIAGGIVATGVTVAFKWILIGRYTRSEHPLWSAFVWRDELINTSQEQLAGELLLRFALGTPLMSLYLRAMGARVGRGVWCETLAVTEYDMIELGDGAAINRGGCLMTHLFHDRLLRIGPARLAPGATLGPAAAVLPDTTVGAGTVVCGHSVVMRGEELPAGTRWQGVPVAPVSRRARPASCCSTPGSASSMAQACGPGPDRPAPPPAGCTCRAPTATRSRWLPGTSGGSGSIWSASSHSTAPSPRRSRRPRNSASSARSSTTPRSSRRSGAPRKRSRRH